MSSLDVQVGGRHYKCFKYQPVELSVKVNLNFIQGNILKYVTRYKLKNGRQDLEKVIHYAQLGYDLMPRNNFVDSDKKELEKFIEDNNFCDTPIETVIYYICYQNWSSIIETANNLIETEYGTIS